MDIFGGAPRVLGYPRPVVAQCGTDATLRCQIGGDPRPDVIWERKNVQIMSEGRYKLSEEGKAYLLTITGVTQQDAGQYICKARNSVGETYAAASLKVEGEAQSQEGGQRQIGVNGMKQPVKENGEYKGHLNGYCTEQNGEHRKENGAEINGDHKWNSRVSEKREEVDLTSDDKPRFLIKPLSLRVDRGEDAAFSCKIWGTPLPEVTWEKDGKRLNDIFESSHFSVSNQDGGWFQLKIYRTRMPDKGVYTCKAINCYGEALAGAVLLVEPVPEREESKLSSNSHTNSQWSPKHRGGRLSLSRVSEEPPVNLSTVKKFGVAEGKHAKFRCCVTGKPKPEIIWKKNGVLLEPGRRHLIFEDREGYYTLKVLYCKEQDTGLYVCAASNALGNTLSAVHLSVKGPAVRFRRPLKDLEVRERDVAVLECEVPDESVPAAWYLEDQRLMPSSKYGMEQKGTRRRLTIHDVGTDDDGVYLCEMPDGAKSIAELSVKGTIVRKLPRKLEVLEGENAAFCVEVEDDDMEVHWFKDGLKLHETHQTILKSFGKTHILVFVNVAHQDSGVVTFVAGRSKTTSRLKVKASRHCPPICPVGAKMDVDRPNSALLTWVPAPNSQTSTRSIFVLERQEVGSQEWQKCFTSETATSAEVTGDSVSCEGDYRFRVCCINKYGRSGHVEFPKVIHLVPGPKIYRRLQGCEVVEGEDARFSIELSASMVGTWFLNSAQLQNGGRYLIQQSQTQHSLVIRGTRTADDTAEVTFIANGVRDSCVLKVKPAVVKFSPLSELDSNKKVDTGDAIVLYCEVTHPFAQVSWFKDGEELQMTDGLSIQSDGNMRRIVIQSADACHSGVYTCKTSDDTIKFNVDVAGPPVEFSPVPEEDLHKSSMELDPVVLLCHVSREDAEVIWYKDGCEIRPSDNITLQAEGTVRRLIIRSAETSDAGSYTCQAGNNSMEFTVNVREPPVKILRKSEIKTNLKSLISDDIVLECELSRANAVGKWYKDGCRIEGDERFCEEEEGSFRSLVILNAELKDSGEYFLDVGDDNISFQVTVEEPPVTIVGNSIDPDYQEMVTGDDLILACEVSRANAPVQWYCNDRLLTNDSRTYIESYGTLRKIIISNVQSSDSGKYMCDAVDDKMITVIRIQEPPVTFVNKEDDIVVTGYEAESVTLTSYVSKETALVRWLKDWTPVEGERFRALMEGHKRTFTIEPLRRSDAGEYTCDVNTDQIHFSLLVKEMRIKFLKPLRDTVAHADGMVTLRCEVCKPKADVQWLKDGVEVVPSRRFSIRADGVERSLTIHRLTREDAGEYTCESRDDHTTASLRVEMPRVVEFLTELHNTTVLEGEDATFKCVVSPEDVQLVWLMDNEAITLGDRFQATQNGLCHTFVIKKCQMLDCSKITAEAEGNFSKATLKVQEAQIMFTKKMEAVMAEEFGDATLETEISLETGEVQWMRQGVVIQPGPRHTLAQNGCTRSLTIHNLTLSDRGTYRCETLHDRTQVKLNVEPRKISIRKGLTDQETFERETASFEVELSHADVEGSWQKDGIRVKPNNQWRVSTNGQVHGLTLSNLTLEDTGTIVFSAEGVRTTARLTVKETPVSILRALADVRVEEEFPATLECEFSRQNVEVRWFKNGTELKPGKNCRIYSMGRKRFCQIQQCSRADSGTYTCETGEINTSCSLEVYEHELEIVQDLEDLYIQEDQNAVFMCEVSLEDVTGEWYKDGHKIRPTSTVKIRTEGTKHFLLMCNVKAEDAGEIRFVARDMESTAFLEVEELPVSIVKPLRDRTALEKHRVILECTVSSPRCSATWYKGREELVSSDRVEISVDGCSHKLVIQQVSVEDEGTYGIEVGEHTSKAKLMVEAQALVMVKELEDVEVTEPEAASFQCEVSVDISKPPIWTLNGETLQSGPSVRLENRGTVHKLTLKNTSVDMSGIVKFTMGKAKTSAMLSVMAE
ncbi:obscurin-like protein 1a isoform X2 [Toxotes jaculatrix]|uniref:obscurin-like protein 1a isoform X2 n=1 Tax=Toxotes jaculatrix TaxID=941984 RepID=UPI001B3AE33D|nr:obscurin-like protein 1a isoform X2 [Toxotes jaculatrix]